MSSNYTKFANNFFVLDHLSVLEVALENGFKLVDTLGDKKVLTNKETGEIFFIKQGENSIDCYKNVETGEEGNVMNFLDARQEIINWDLLGYLEKRLGNKIYDLDYTSKAHRNADSQNAIDIDNQEIPVQNLDIKKSSQQTKLPEELASYSSAVNTPSGKTQDQKKSFSHELLYERCKIPPRVLSSGLFPHGNGSYQDDSVSCKEVRFKTQGEKEGVLILREKTDFKTKQVSHELACEGDPNSICVFNNRPRENKNEVRPIILTTNPIEAMSVYSLYPNASENTTFVSVATEGLSYKSALNINILNKDINKGVCVADNSNIRIACANHVQGQLFGIEAKCQLGGVRYVARRGAFFFFLKDREKVAPIKVTKNPDKQTLTLRCTLPNLETEDKNFAVDTLKQGLFGAKIDIAENRSGLATITLKTTMDLASLKQLNNNLSELTGIYSDTSKGIRWNQDMQESLNNNKTKEQTQALSMSN